ERRIQRRWDHSAGLAQLRQRRTASLMSGHNEPNAGDLETLKALFLERLIEKARDPNIRASALAVIAKYLDTAGMIEKVPATPTGLSRYTPDHLPFKGDEETTGASNPPADLPF